MHLQCREADFDAAFERMKENKIPYGDSFHTVGNNSARQ